MRAETPLLFLGTLVLACVLASPALSTPPPLSFALQAAAEDAEERRSAPWTLTHVEETIQTFTARDSSSGQVVFTDGEERLEVTAEASSPFQLLWALYFSSDPAALHELGPMPTAVASTYELIQGVLAVCYTATEASEAHRLCFDQTYRHVAYARMELHGATWEVHITADGTSITISRDGSMVARLRHS